MAEKNKIVQLERVGSKKDLIKITFDREMSPHKSTLYVLAALDKCFKHKFYNIIIDMNNIDHFANDVVAAIIEATAKVRRKGGDIKLINLSPSGEEAIAAFNAHMYLSVKSEES